MAQDHGLCRKKVSQQMDRCTGRHCRPVLQLPTGQFSQLANCWNNKLATILAHMDMNGAMKQNEMDGGKATERGQMMRAVGMAGKTQPAEQQLQATQPADAPSGTGLEETTSRWPVSQQSPQLPMMLARLPCS